MKRTDPVKPLTGHAHYIRVFDCMLYAMLLKIMFPKLTQAPRNKWGAEVVTFHKMRVGIYYTAPTKYIEGNKYHIPRDKMSKQYFSNPTITSRTPGGLSAGTTGAGVWAASQFSQKQRYY